MQYEQQTAKDLAQLNRAQHYHQTTCNEVNWTLLSYMTTAHTSCDFTKPHTSGVSRLG